MVPRMKSKNPNRNCSITLPSLWLVVGVVMSLCPVSSRAQEQVDTTDCKAIRDQVPGLLEQAMATGERLEELAVQANEALKCHNGDIDHGWAIWLLDARAYGLDGLQRYSEAQEAVDEFLSTYLTRADSLAIARFYMWDLRFKHFDGRFKEALESYNEGLPYAHKLPEDLYRHYLLNAGSVHMAQVDTPHA